VRRIVLSAVLMISGAVFAQTPGAAHAGPHLKCTMTFRLSGWSAFFKAADGAGTVRCSNGQSMDVKLRARGGGLSVGESTVDDGLGEFSAVESIDEVLGTYAAAEARADAVKSAARRMMRKGEVSLALTGNGRRPDPGVAFGKLSITRS